MPPVVSIRFKPVTKIYFFDPGEFDSLEVRTAVIVETSRGEELGWVAAPIKEVLKPEIKGKLKSVKRLATPLDLVRMESFRAKESETLEKVRQKARQLELPMKVIKAEYSYDGSRVMFSFSSEQRVDFRELVRELGRMLRTRIEMKQIGARDETKIIDGYGRCGRQLCCSSWLNEFHPVSIRMAKQQSLPLAPSEISGLCGRLLCCLAYENEMYSEIRAKLPDVGAKVKFEAGVGIVRGVNVLKEAVLVLIEPENLVEVPVSQIEVLEVGPRRKRKIKNGSKTNR